jgi:sugar O-acyltransferase (sialic acid O-acetyltransferase NeuD family)
VSALEPLYIAGAGALGRELYAWFHEDAGPSDPRKAVMLDDSRPGVQRIDSVVGDPSALVLVAIEEPAARALVTSRLHPKRPVIRYVHRSVVKGLPNVIGRDSLLLPQALVSTNVALGQGVVLNTGAKVGHDCVVGNFCTIHSGVVLCGGVRVGDLTRVGANSVVLPGVSIGKGCVVGPGSVVVRDLPPNCVAFGNPCRVIQKA